MDTAEPLSLPTKPKQSAVGEEINPPRSLPAYPAANISRPKPAAPSSRSSLSSKPDVKELPKRPVHQLAHSISETHRPLDKPVGSRLNRRINSDPQIGTHHSVLLVAEESKRSVTSLCTENANCCLRYNLVLCACTNFDFLSLFFSPL